MRYLLANLALTVLSSVALTGCSKIVPDGAETVFFGSDHPEATPYNPELDAASAVDAALARAAENDRRVLLVMGANWCHDSRALAGWLETERFERLVADQFELVFVNVGMPQEGDGFNLDIARRFGIEELPGTPNLLVLTPEGSLVNDDSATSWRDAASRDEDAIYDELVELAHRPA